MVPPAVPAMELTVTSALPDLLGAAAEPAVMVLPGPFCTKLKEFSFWPSAAASEGERSAMRPMFSVVSVISAPLMKTALVMPKDTARPLPMVNPPLNESSVWLPTACQMLPLGSCCGGCARPLPAAALSNSPRQLETQGSAVAALRSSGEIKTIRNPQARALAGQKSLVRRAFHCFPWEHGVPHAIPLPS